MKPLTAVQTNIKDNLLAEAAVRNLPADLVVVRGENLQANLKSRFLQNEPERMLLEVPTHDGRPVILQPGQFIEVYFKVEHERFGFDSQVVGYSRVRLNDDTTVEAIGLAPPHFLELRQRRKFYRVSVASLPAMAAGLWPLEVEQEFGDPIQSRLCNLSAGGVALLVDRQRWQFTSDQKFRLRFCLPGQDDAFEFQAVVCHVRHVFHSRRQIIGLAFLPNQQPIAHRDAMDRIAHFVAARQREELFQARPHPHVGLS